MQCIVTYAIGMYSLKSVLRYNFFHFGYLSPGHCSREQGYEDPWLFFNAKRGARAKKFGKHCSIQYVMPSCIVRPQ